MSPMSYLCNYFITRAPNNKLRAFKYNNKKQCVLCLTFINNNSKIHNKTVIKMITCLALGVYIIINITRPSKNKLRALKLNNKTIIYSA